MMNGIDLTENSLILWNQDPESSLPYSSQFVISDKPGYGAPQHWLTKSMLLAINAQSNWIEQMEKLAILCYCLDLL